MNREEPEDAEATLDLPNRYRVSELVGRGAMGEVFRVRDLSLNRDVALKLISEEISDEQVRARFLEEVQVTAQLEHPGIVPIYDFGFAGSRPFYTMKLIRGEAWEAALASMDRRDPVALRRAVATLASVCDAMAYAHDRGVTHRDLKPGNVAVGKFGEVVVLDWGLAKTLASDALRGEELVASSIPEEQRTLYGSVTGTLDYMPPEQARGEIDRIGPHSDVYALGAVLWEILSGAPPFGAGRRAESTFNELIRDRVPTEFPQSAGSPPELIELALAATRSDPGARPAQAGVLASGLRAWLDGEQTRDRAMQIVAEAQDRLRRAQELRAAADQTLERYVAEARVTHPLASADEKRLVWALEDESRQRAEEAERLELAVTEQLEGALRLAPGMPAAHEVLAALYRELHERSELSDPARAQRLARQLRRHDQEARHAAYLSGVGALTLHTDPPGADATLFEFKERDRRLEPVRVEELGPTPLVKVPLDMGSYLVELKLAGRETVRYPVQIRRLEHWDGCAPGSSEPFAIPMPAAGEVPPGQIYVPPGWAQLAGDPFAANAISGRRLWVDGFIIDEFPLSCEQYVAYLNELLDEGDEQAALDAWPALSYWEAKVPEEFRGDQWIDRDDSGRFVQRMGDPRWPVTLVNWSQSAAYTLWRATREGLPWRLPAEMEWEKAARGVDGRFFPWGDRFDAGIAHTRHVIVAEDVRGLKCTVDAYPHDLSPYGVRGMGGNVRDWCQDAGQTDGPKVVDGRPVLSNGEGVKGPGMNGMHRIHKGGCWNQGVESARCAFRDGPPFIFSDTTLGFRCARPWPAVSPT